MTDSFWEEYSVTIQLSNEMKKLIEDMCLWRYEVIVLDPQTWINLGWPTASQVCAYVENDLQIPSNSLRLSVMKSTLDARERFCLGCNVNENITALLDQREMRKLSKV